MSCGRPGCEHSWIIDFRRVARHALESDRYHFTVIALPYQILQDSLLVALSHGEYSLPESHPYNSRLSTILALRNSLDRHILIHHPRYPPFLLSAIFLSTIFAIRYPSFRPSCDPPLYLQPLYPSLSLSAIHLLSIHASATLAICGPLILSATDVIRHIQLSAVLKYSPPGA